MAPAGQDGIDSDPETRLVNRDHILRLGLPFRVVHECCGVAFVCRAGITDDLALCQKRHGRNTRGAGQNTAGRHEAKNCACTEPGGGAGNKQALSVVHQVVSFMGRDRWTYSYGARIVSVDDEERNAPVGGHDRLSQTMIDGLLPSKNPLSPENIACGVDS